MVQDQAGASGVKVFEEDVSTLSGNLTQIRVIGEGGCSRAGRRVSRGRPGLKRCRKTFLLRFAKILTRWLNPGGKKRH